MTIIICAQALAFSRVVLQVSQSGHDAEDTQAEDTESGAHRSKEQRKRRDSDPQFVPSTKAVVLQSPSESDCSPSDTHTPRVSCTVNLLSKPCAFCPAAGGRT